jgi:hypothetical protein
MAQLTWDDVVVTPNGVDLKNLVRLRQSSQRWDRLPAWVISYFEVRLSQDHRVVNRKLKLEFPASNIGRDSADGIAPSFWHVEHVIRPERPDFCVGCTRGGLVDQCYRAVGDALRLAANRRTVNLK